MKKAPEKSRLVAYLRVSTDEQTESGLGLDAQREALEAYAKMKGFELVEVITDAGVSGGVPIAERTGGAELADMVRARQVDAVLVTKLDRLSRSTVDALQTLEAWDKRGVAFHVLDMGGNTVDSKTSAGRFLLTVLAAVSEMERGQIKERTAAALAEKRRRREKTGGAYTPYGFKLDKRGRMVRDSAESKVSKRMKRLRARGHSLRKIAERLNADGITTKTGAAWKASQVSRALTIWDRWTAAA